MMRNPKANGQMNPPKVFGRDKALGQTVTIRKGGYKGLLGIVKDATDTHARVELHTKSKIVNVPKADLIFKDKNTGRVIDINMRGGFGGGRGGGSAGSGGRGGGYGGGSGGSSGWDGSRTPAAAGGFGSRTPAWGASKRKSRHHCPSVRSSMLTCAQPPLLLILPPGIATPTLRDPAHPHPPGRTAHAQSTLTTATGQLTVVQLLMVVRPGEQAPRRPPRTATGSDPGPPPSLAAMAATVAATTHGAAAVRHPPPMAPRLPHPVPVETTHGATHPGPAPQSPTARQLPVPVSAPRHPRHSTHPPQEDTRLLPHQPRSVLLHQVLAGRAAGVQTQRPHRLLVRRLPEQLAVTTVLRRRRHMVPLRRQLLDRDMKMTIRSHMHITIAFPTWSSRARHINRDRVVDSEGCFQGWMDELLTRSLWSLAVRFGAEYCDGLSFGAAAWRSVCLWN
jgi:hypothetical protein